MPPTLTIAYMTARKEPKIEWFLDSLLREINTEGLLDSVLRKVIIVDRWKDNRALPLLREFNKDDLMKWVSPKPCVWQGPHRLTKEDWFAAANARNTPLCLCDTDWLSYVDDLSVLLPGWLQSIREAMAGNYFVFGAYRKVKDLVVENGIIKSFTPFPEGVDNRLAQVTEDVSKCSGGWLYGCSLAGPVEQFLQVGGWPEYADGMGFEDVILGHALQNNGFDLRYDRRMMTFESEELHYAETPFRRTDKGASPRDKSHSALDIARASKYFPNYYEGGIRALRAHVLAGNPFPTCGVPEHCWFDGMAVKDHV